jgi:DNA-binding response OmpR family regulator
MSLAAIKESENFSTEYESWPLVLLIDDTSVTLELEEKYLHSVGFRVKTASTLFEIEENLKKGVFSLAVIDTGFLGGQGTNVIRHMRKLCHDENLKILATSVSSNASLKRKCIEAGATDFLIKPTPRPKFLRELKKLTSQGIRGAERVSQKTKIEYTCELKKILADTLDLSSEGAHIASMSENKPPVNTEMSLLLLLPAHDKPLEVSGVVKRHTGEGFGVKFGDLSRNAQRVLDRFLTKYSCENKATIFYL